MVGETKYGMTKNLRSMSYDTNKAIVKRGAIPLLDNILNAPLNYQPPSNETNNSETISHKNIYNFIKYLRKLITII